MSEKPVRKRVVQSLDVAEVSRSQRENELAYVMSLRGLSPKELGEHFVRNITRMNEMSGLFGGLLYYPRGAFHFKTMEEKNEYDRRMAARSAAIKLQKIQSGQEP